MEGARVFREHQVAYLVAKRQVARGRGHLAIGEAQRRVHPCHRAAEQRLKKPEKGLWTAAPSLVRSPVAVQGGARRRAHPLRVETRGRAFPRLVVNREHQGLQQGVVLRARHQRAY